MLGFGRYGGHYTACINDLYSVGVHTSDTSAAPTLTAAPTQTAALTQTAAAAAAVQDGQPVIPAARWFAFNDSRVSPVLPEQLSLQYGTIFSLWILCVFAPLSLF